MPKIKKVAASVSHLTIEKNFSIEKAVKDDDDSIKEIREGRGSRGRRGVPARATGWTQDVLPEQSLGIEQPSFGSEQP